MEYKSDIPYAPSINLFLIKLFRKLQIRIKGKSNEPN